MKWTNEFNIEPAVASAIRGWPYEREGQVSATGLITPTQVTRLRSQHYGGIERDVSDGLWALLGRSVHAMLEKADQAGALVEESLVMEIGGVKVSGRPDLYRDYTVKDYKVTSTYSLMDKDVKPDWVEQLNFYRLLYESYGYEVRKLRIVAILRDWVKGRRFSKGYPKIPFQEVVVPRWPLDETKHRMEQRVGAWQLARRGISVLCTAEERWAKPDIWAVKVKGRKKALKLFENSDDAEAFSADNAGPGTYVEYRRGSSVRCPDYCDVAQWCDQWAGIQRKEEEAKKETEDPKPLIEVFV